MASHQVRRQPRPPGVSPRPIPRRRLRARFFPHARYLCVIARCVGTCRLCGRGPDLSRHQHRGSRRNRGAGEQDIANQPGDVAFIGQAVRSATTKSSPSCPMLKGLVIPNELALAGQSDGATSVMALAYDIHDVVTSLAIRAVVDLSGAEIETTAGAYARRDGPPLLVVQSAVDDCNPPQNAVALYNAVSGSQKWFLDVFDADHLGPYDGSDVSALGVVSRVTSRFCARVRERAPWRGLCHHVR